MGFILDKHKNRAPLDGKRREGNATITTNKKCQRCFSSNHWTYECELKPGDVGTYVSRESKTQMLNKSGGKKKFQEFAKFGKDEELMFDERKNASES